MKQAINLGFVEFRRGETQKRPLQEALELCRNAQFMQLDYLSSLDEKNFLDTAKRERELIDSFGMRVIQSTRIHDNRYGIEMHKPAFFRTIPREEVI